MSLTDSMAEHLYKLWGGPPGPRADALVGPSRLPKALVFSNKRAGPGGPAQTGGSAPQIMQDCEIGKTKWHWARLPALQRRFSTVPNKCMLLPHHDNGK